MAYGPWIFGPSGTSIQIPYTQKASIGTDAVSAFDQIVIAAQRTVPLSFSGSVVHISGADATQNAILMDSFAERSRLIFRRAGGTAAVPSATVSGAEIGGELWAGFGTTAYSGTRAGVVANATETWTDSAQGTSIYFQTTTTGAATLTTRMNIDGVGSLAIGQSSTASEVTAILEVESTTKGFLPPRMSATQRNAISSPVAGLQVYNSTSGLNETYNGTAWIGVDFQMVLFGGNSAASTVCAASPCTVATTPKVGAKITSVTRNTTGVYDIVGLDSAKYGCIANGYTGVNRLPGFQDTPNSTGSTVRINFSADVGYVLVHCYGTP